MHLAQAGALGSAMMDRMQYVVRMLKRAANEAEERAAAAERDRDIARAERDEALALLRRCASFKKGGDACGQEATKRRCRNYSDTLADDAAPQA